MKVITQYIKPVLLESIFLGEMFECPFDESVENKYDNDRTPINTPLMRIQAYSNTDMKDGYLFAVDPHTGYTYMIPRYKEVIPLEGELTVKK